MLHKKVVKSVLNKHKQGDSWFLDDYSVNGYEGCSCNCLYCYIRGSRYGENMDDHVSVKINAAEILDKQLASGAGKNQDGFVTVGSATDAYIHHDITYKITGKLLMVLLKYRFPVFIYILKLISWCRRLNMTTNTMPGKQSAGLKIILRKTNNNTGK